MIAAVTCYTNCTQEVFRAEGSALCTCGETYASHPVCAGSRVPPELSSSTKPEYTAHVLCDGLHVHL